MKRLNTTTLHSLQRWGVAALLLLLVACSKKDDFEVPAQLTNIPHPTLKVERVWRVSTGDKAEARLRLGLGIAVNGNRVYAANHKGVVDAFDLATGRRIWRTKTRAPLAGGPGVSDNLIAVGSSEGEVIALSASHGRILWHVFLSGEILSAPAISPKVIAVRTVDGKLHGLSPVDGHELWMQEQDVPRLSLRGTGRPVIDGNLAICGFDNGKVMAVNMNDGSVLWQTTVAPPHGRTELERLVDIDSAVKVAGDDVYAVAFQGRVAMLARDTGQIWWSHPASSYRSMGIDDQNLYMATADGEIVALRRQSGAEIWRQTVLMYRGLSSITATDNSIVVGDFQGYVHFFNKTTGALEARVREGKARISNAPIVAGNLLLVGDDVGRITAYRVIPIFPPPTSAAAPPKRKRRRHKR